MKSTSDTRQKIKELIKRGHDQNEVKYAKLRILLSNHPKKWVREYRDVAELYDCMIEESIEDEWSGLPRIIGCSLIVLTGCAANLVFLVVPKNPLTMSLAAITNLGLFAAFHSEYNSEPERKAETDIEKILIKYKLCVDPDAISSGSIGRSR